METPPQEPENPRPEPPQEPQPQPPQALEKENG